MPQNFEIRVISLKNQLDRREKINNLFNNKNIMSNINRKFLFKWIPLIQAERMIENIMSFKVNPIYFIDIICLNLFS